MKLVALICHECDEEIPEDEINTLDARELGDGTVCVSCPHCKHDLALLAPPGS